MIRLLIVFSFLGYSNFLLAGSHNKKAMGHSKGVIKVLSHKTVDQTVSSFKELIQKKGLNLFAEVNHQNNAQGVGLEMPQATVLIFGNPKIGTPIMNESITAGLDLPVKMLVYETKDNKVFLSYNDPLWLAKRHGVSTELPQIKKMAQVLKGLSQKAAARNIK